MFPRDGTQPGTNGKRRVNLSKLYILGGTHWGGTQAGTHGIGGAGAGLCWQTPGQRTDGVATGEAIEQGCPEFREQYARTREAQPDLKSKWAPLVTIFQILAKHRPGAMMAMGSLPVTPRPATSRLLAVCLATGNEPVAKCAHHHGQRPSPGTSVRAMRSAPIKLHWCGPGAELPPRQPGRWPGS